jgi:ADP-ribosylglycohydrolase
MGGSLFTGDPVDRLGRAVLSLEGLSCGDAFGECFFLPRPEFIYRTGNQVLPPAPWPVTDDTMMAVSVVESLRVHGQIVEEWLAEHFAALYDVERGYGAAMHSLLPAIRVRGGRFWREESRALFQGSGSYGNGAAMRVAPVGAFFADDLEALTEQAERSAVTTHAHSEAVAGAIAVALGAAFAWNSRSAAPPAQAEFLQGIWERTPESEVRAGIEKAIRLGDSATTLEAAAELGNGWRITAMDTVPFVLWSAGRWMADFEGAMWQTVSAGGDKDTTCAMVGGIVALRVGLEGIPAEWRRRRELLGPLFQNTGSNWNAYR